MKAHLLIFCWVGILVFGPLLIWAGLYLDSVDPNLIWYGAAVLIGSSLVYLIITRPRSTDFVTGYFQFWAVGAFFLSLISVPVLSIPFYMAMAAPVLLPLLVIGSAVCERRGSDLNVRAPFYTAAWILGFIVPLHFPVEIKKEFAHEEPLVLTDDQLADKQPEFIDSPAMWEEVLEMEPGKFTLLINKSASVIGLDVAKVEERNAGVAKMCFPTYEAAVQFLQREQLPWVPSVQLVDQKVKSFGDKAYAAIDEYTQHHAARLGGGRQAFLRRLLDELPKNGQTDAAAFVAAALELGGADIVVSEEIKSLARELQKEFLSNQLISKPIGFYAESDELSRIFRQDRFCQQPLLPEIAKVIERAIASDTDCDSAYGGILNLQARLTNSASSFSVLDYTAATNAGGEVALFPASTSVENELFEMLYQAPELPGENIMNRLIRSIQEGLINLEPDENSGWYDYQIYALETLLLPERGQEGEKLFLSRTYKERLVEAFRTILTKQRELHVKQVELMSTIGGDWSPDYIDIWPDISTEPTATYYLRTARALRFLETAVAGILVDEFDAITIDGEPMSDLIKNHQNLLYGLYFQVCQDIGMEPRLLDSELDAHQLERARAEAARWLEHCKDDEAMKEDVRYIVPALTDGTQSNVRYWMTTGIRLEKVKAEYLRPPKLELGSGPTVEPGNILGYGQSIRFVPYEFYLPVEMFAEATGPNVPYTREEFRQICDDAGSPEEIIDSIASGKIKTGSSFAFLCAAIAGAAMMLVFVRQAIKRHS